MLGNKPSPNPIENEMKKLEFTEQMTLDGSDPFERAVMEIVWMHRKVLDSHSDRFARAIEYLKGQI